MIGIIVPAHNEEAVVAQCIESLLIAGEHPALAGEEVCVVIVLDQCTDGTQRVVSRYPVQSLDVSHCNVGRTRAAGAELMLGQGARWLAFTDADTVVPATWLVDQLRFRTDAVCGTVRIDDWSLHAEEVRTRYDALYTPVEGHKHVQHGRQRSGVPSGGRFQAFESPRRRPSGSGPERSGCVDHLDFHELRDYQRTSGLPLPRRIWRLPAIAVDQRATRSRESLTRGVSAGIFQG